MVGVGPLFYEMGLRVQGEFEGDRMIDRHRHTIIAATPTQATIPASPTPPAPNPTRPTSIKRLSPKP